MLSLMFLGDGRNCARRSLWVIYHVCERGDKAYRVQPSPTTARHVLSGRMQSRLPRFSSLHVPHSQEARAHNTGICAGRPAQPRVRRRPKSMSTTPSAVTQHLHPDLGQATPCFRTLTQPCLAEIGFLTMNWQLSGPATLHCNRGEDVECICRCLESRIPADLLENSFLPECNPVSAA